MPHAEESSPAPVINGEMPTSQFLSHLNSHPIVSDSVSTFKSNKLGSLTINYADKTYATFVSPLLPYAATPYSLVSPYVSKADDLAAKGLDKVDATFPLITKDTSTIKGTAFSVVAFPQKKAFELKDHIFGTWGSEYKKCGGNGVVAGGKAIITTGLVITSESLNWFSMWLSKKQEQGEVQVKEIKEKVLN
ncbi:MAG: hypothetical protein MMC23_006917 [Stictis urceolatum]|nr:hypothetical protein [Stictis urceolata]